MYFSGKKFLGEGRHLTTHLRTPFFARELQLRWLIRHLLVCTDVIKYTLSQIPSLGRKIGGIYSARPDNQFV